MDNLSKKAINDLSNSRNDLFSFECLGYCGYTKGLVPYITKRLPLFLQNSANVAAILEGRRFWGINQVLSSLICVQTPNTTRLTNKSIFISWTDREVNLDQLKDDW